MKIIIEWDDLNVTAILFTPLIEIIKVFSHVEITMLNES